MNQNKIVPLKAQYILMVIPILNCLVLFIWLYNYSRAKKDSKIFGKSLLVIFLSTIPIVIIQIILSKIIVNSSANIFVDNLMSYLIPLSMAFNLIRYQKKVFTE